MSNATRQLTVIMFTDIAGYTSVMGKDSAKALDLLRVSKEIQKPLVQKHKGKWLKEMGDGVMLQFNTALDAVNCAIEIQELARAKLDGKLRIGIHLGDVTIGENDVHGDGVNVAARLESTADPGGIYISESVEKAIRGQTDVQTKYLGELKLKNVDYGVRTYAVQGVGLPVPSSKDKKQLSGRFRAEIKRRGVLRAGITYVLVALLLLVLFNETESFPQWAFPVLLTALIVGFPIALYLAWNYEISPDGFVRTTSAESWQNPYREAKRKPLTSNLIMGALALIILAMFVYPRYLNNPSANTANTEEIIIAVLPFDNFSQEREENQYLCDGFMEEILNHLSRIRSIQVRSRSSVEQYRENKPTIPEIAQKLGTTHILEGSIQKIGDRLRITTQLIDAGDRHIWQARYDEQVSDIFQLQTRIAKQIADQLQIQLTPEEVEAIEIPPTDNLVAYNYYLRAKEYGRNWDDYENAILLYKKAEKEDPNFVLSIIGRAGLYWGALNARLFDLFPQEDIDSILVLCNRAITINPNIAEAYHVRGLYYRLKGDSERERQDTERAFELNPNGAWYIGALGNLHFANQNYIRGLQLIHKAERLSYGDPRLVWMYAGLGEKYLEIGDTAEARRYWNKTFSVVPDFTNGYFNLVLIELWLREWDRAYELIEIWATNTGSQQFERYFNHRIWGTYYLLTHKYAEAFTRFEKANIREDDYLFWRIYYGMALWLYGKKQEGEQMLHEAIQYNDYDPAYSDNDFKFAAIHAFLGNKEEAYKLLRKSKWRATALYEVNQDVWFSNINQEQEFKDIVDSVKAERRKVRDEIARLKAAGQWELQ